MIDMQLGGGELLQGGTSRNDQDITKTPRDKGFFHSRDEGEYGGYESADEDGKGFLFLCRIYQELYWAILPAIDDTVTFP
jgi:hypothetical protein